MKIEELDRLQELLMLYRAEKCKEYKNDKHYNVYLDISCSDCPAKDLIFSNDGDFIGSNCMMSILSERTPAYRGGCFLIQRERHYSSEELR